MYISGIFVIWSKLSPAFIQKVKQIALGCLRGGQHRSRGGPPRGPTSRFPPPKRAAAGISQATGSKMRAQI